MVLECLPFSINLAFVNLSHNGLNSLDCQKNLMDLISSSWSLVEINISYTNLLNPLDILKCIDLKSRSLQAFHMDGEFNSMKMINNARAILG